MNLDRAGQHKGATVPTSRRPCACALITAPILLAAKDTSSLAAKEINRLAALAAKNTSSLAAKETNSPAAKETNGLAAKRSDRNPGMYEA